MANTGAPWNIPYVEPTDIPRTYPEDSEDLALAIAAGLSAAGNAGIGSNVVQTVKTNTFTTTSTSYTTVTGLTATITPSSNTAKVLIIAQIAYGLSGADQTGSVRVSGGNATAYVGNASGNRTRGVFGGIGNATASMLASYTIVYVDSPSTTSPTTYAVECMRGSFTPGTVYINRSADNSDQNNRTVGASSITVIEVAP